MALSVGFIRFVSSTDATQATGFLTFPPVGLFPTEHASLSLDALRYNNLVLVAGLQLAGFRVITTGRFWVIPEGFY